MALQVLYFCSQMQERLEKSQEELIEMQVWFLLIYSLFEG